jgi:hypothetical protein
MLGILYVLAVLLSPYSIAERESIGNILLRKHRLNLCSICHSAPIRRSQIVVYCRVGNSSSRLNKSGTAIRVLATCLVDAPQWFLQSDSMTLLTSGDNMCRALGLGKSCRPPRGFHFSIVLIFTFKSETIAASFNPSLSRTWTRTRFSLFSCAYNQLVIIDCFTWILLSSLSATCKIISPLSVDIAQLCLICACVESGPWISCAPCTGCLKRNDPSS